MSFSSAASKGKISYDALTISLHWITAALVIFLFGSAEMWGFVERGDALRHELQFLHVSCGILLLPVILLRVVWRFAHRGDLPPAAAGLQELLAKGTHLALYLLLVTQVTLGFLYRWAQGEAFSFFGLFSLPRIIDIDAPWRRPIGELHNDVAWLIVALVGLHALAVLYHHYFLKDRLWARMIPYSGGHKSQLYLCAPLLPGPAYTAAATGHLGDLSRLALLAKETLALVEKGELMAGTVQISDFEGHGIGFDDVDARDDPSVWQDELV